MRDKLDRLIQPLLEADYVRNLVVRIWHDNTDVLLGRTRVEAGPPPRGDTCFEIGSLTKLFTLFLLGKQVNAGLIDLDSPVHEFLPEVPALRRGPKRRMTIRHLATNRSGLWRDPELTAKEDPLQPGARFTVEDLHGFLTDSELRSEPGTEWCYSNAGFGLLGYIMGKRAGLGYFPLLEVSVLAPLGLTHTVLCVPPDSRSRLAQGHTADGDPVPAREPDSDNPLLAAGALTSTSKDMLAFARAWIEGDRGPLGSAVDIVENRLGYGQNGLYGGAGQGTGMHACLFLSREKQVAATMLADTATIYVLAVGRTIFDLLCNGGAEPVSLPQPIPGPLVWDPGWLGDYIPPPNPAVPPNAVMEIRHTDVGLTWTVRTGDYVDPPIRLYPKAPGRFFIKKHDVEFEFGDGFFKLIPGRFCVSAWGGTLVCEQRDISKSVANGST